MKRAMILGLLAALSGQAARGQWCVATNGNDANTGLGWDQAVATISNAVRKAHLAGGGLDEVSNGVYVLTGGGISISAGTTVRGVNGRDYTVVDGNGTTRCFTLSHAGAVLQGLTVSNGYVGSGQVGGGVAIVQGSVYDCRITHNTASNYYGGGIGIVPSVKTTITVTNCILSHNRANSGGGLGVYDYNGVASNIIVGCDFVSNTLYQRSEEPYGGGLLFWGSNLVVRGCRFYGNRHTYGSGSGYGAGLAVNPNAANVNVLIENSEFVGNIITSVPSVNAGGGIYLASPGCVVRNCLLASNRCYGVPRGGGIYYQTPTNRINVLESCTIVGNSTTVGYPSGAGAYIAGSGHVEVWNCLVWSNRETAAASDWNFPYPAGSASERTNYVHYTCTPQAMGGAGNTRNPPLFADFAGGDYRVLAESPCVLAGTNRPWMEAGRDLDGHPRLDRFTRRVDMGPYQRLLRGTLMKVQ